jgi:hypothetical protein
LSRLKIAVIGSINEDFIVHKGVERHSYGGILYNLAALSTLLPQAEIRPLACLGTNVWPKVGRLASSLKNIDWSKTRKLSRKSNRVHLYYSPAGEKKERLEFPVPAFQFGHLKPALKSDVILLNFISGWEVSPGPFKRLRRQFSGLIHVDVHSFLLGMRKNGERFARVPKNWEVLLDADFVQTNQKEWELAAGLRFTRDNFLGFCEKWKKKGWKAIIVTLAEQGAAMVFRRGGLQYVAVRAPKIPKAEQTGAGDFFAAGFICGLFQNRSLPPALSNGVLTASWKCRHEGIEAVLKHRQGLKRILTTGKSGSKLSETRKEVEGRPRQAGQIPGGSRNPLKGRMG